MTAFLGDLQHGVRQLIHRPVFAAAASAVVARVLESLLYGISGFDPVAYGSAAGLLLLVALLANLVPAFAAARIDPVRALRSK